MNAKRLEEGSEYAEYDADGALSQMQSYRPTRNYRNCDCNMNEQMLNVPRVGLLCGACCYTRRWLASELLELAEPHNLRRYDCGIFYCRLQVFWRRRSSGA